MRSISINYKVCHILHALDTIPNMGINTYNWEQPWDLHCLLSTIVQLKNDHLRPLLQNIQVRPAFLRPATPGTHRENLMIKGQCKNIINKSQENVSAAHHSHPTAENPGYFNTIKAQENNLKSKHIKMIMAFKKKMHKSLKFRGKPFKSEGNE